MGDLRNLNRAVQAYTYPSVEFAQAVREWIGKATAKMESASEASRPRIAEWERRVEPASEGAKVEPEPVGCWTDCPVCNQHFYARPYPKPAQPETAAPVGEMPDALDTACDLLEWGGNVNAAAALRDAWRTHAAQPKVAMTEELRDALDWLEMLAAGRENDGPAWHKTVADAKRSIAAVRAQVSQPVKLEKVRSLLMDLEPMDWPSGEHAAALAELDAAEGKVAG